MVREEKREQVGRVFEELTAKLYGGEIQENGINDSEFGNPDIVNGERNQVYESKSSISSDHHKFRPRQIDHYHNLVNSDFPVVNGRLLEDSEAYYFLWQHGRQGVSKFDGNELEKELVTNIRRLLVVSFDVIEAGASVWDTTGHTCSWGETYMFRSSERKALTYDTEKELSRMGLNIDDYCVESEVVPKGEYRYKWWGLPEFLVTKVVKNGLRDVERR
jgi:hypothetical protein